MQIDLDQHAPSSEPFRSQVCIVGAGIAGLTLAHRLAQQGIDVALLEAGGLAPSPLAEDRVFGGTSLRWGGQLLPLPAGSTWPTPDLTPYYRAVEQILAVDDLPYEAHAFYTATQAPPPPLLEQLPSITPRLSKWTPFSHRNLANTIGKSLRTHNRVTLYLNAPATEVLLAPQRNRVEAVLVRTLSGHTFRFEAPHIVIPAGTLETSRLLLASRTIDPAGVGNQYDQVGRNLHNHLTIPAATLTGTARREALKTFQPWMFNGTLHSLKLESAPHFSQSHGINRVLAHVTFEDQEDSGLSVLRNLLIARQRGDIKESIISNAVRIPSAAWNALRVAFEARTRHRRFIPAQTKVGLTLNAAQDVSPDSRMTLTEHLDPFGVPNFTLNTRVSEQELRTLRTFAAYLRSRLEDNGMAGAIWEPALFDADLPLQTLDDARHPMGGALMGVNPRTSVVDPNLTVHDIPNLHIASAATFPADGSPLPTLPLMALSLRLADHITPRLNS